MKPEEIDFFTRFMEIHTEFLEAKGWREGPDPPDVIVIDSAGNDIGVELTEWLIPEQTTHSITLQENEVRWLQSLDTESHSQPQHFGSVQISFLDDTKFSTTEKHSFRREFYDLIAYVDQNWSGIFGRSPQKVWLDFTDYPALSRHVRHLWFYDLPLMRPPLGTRWVVSEAKGGAFDPTWASGALFDRIETKASKPEYASLASKLGLRSFVLLLHHGLRGLLHNTPFEGVNRKLDDLVAEAKHKVATLQGPFDQVYLYFDYNEGALVRLYP